MAYRGPTQEEATFVDVRTDKRARANSRNPTALSVRVHYCTCGFGCAGCFLPLVYVSDVDGIAYCFDFPYP